MKRTLCAAAAALVFGAAVQSASAQNVTITPVGSHPGELCDRDRATLFQDPTGVRLLYDAGHSVLGADDERLGTLHAVLLSHAHGELRPASRTAAFIGRLKEGRASHLAISGRAMGFDGTGKCVSGC